MLPRSAHRIGKNGKSGTNQTAFNQCVETGLLGLRPASAPPYISMCKAFAVSSSKF